VRAQDHRWPRPLANEPPYRSIALIAITKYVDCNVYGERITISAQKTSNRLHLSDAMTRCAETIVPIARDSDQLEKLVSTI
jgi:hypothetical protein